ncbi:hypothetical protein T4B_9568 [Trichinella pseudospiralis]|uniref:Uncharacterized protein n=1 Tax=Trichinella pseudospiralis TaxID=6337 RepID=A0A0V1GX55_TRIPS|nr:hypothetical protein T4B_9568 [Trichinella pseudospiralis]
MVSTTVSIHAFLAGKLLLAVYCLCTDKDIATYRFILSKSGKPAILSVNLNPQTIICDFEISLILYYLEQR